MIAGLRMRARRLAEHRLPALTRLKSPEPLPIQLHRRRIYILPTGFGVGFAVLLFVMLLGALNYGNNAALLLTCLLGGAAVNSMLSAFRALEGLRLEHIEAAPVRAGDPLRLTLHIAATSRRRPALRVGTAAVEETLACDADATTQVELHLPTERRGWMPVPQLRVASTWPYGLFRAWSWMHPRERALVYPRPEAFGPPPRGLAEHAHRNHPFGGDDAATLRGYRSGDPLKRVAWKASARHDDLLVRETEQPAAHATWRLDWDDIHGLDDETRIARLARWVDEAHRAGVHWSLHLPGRRLGPAAGIVHFHHCLSELAQWP